MSAALRVVVADDERPARSFLLALLRSFDDVAVVGEDFFGHDQSALIGQRIVNVADQSVPA